VTAIVQSRVPTIHLPPVSRDHRPNVQGLATGKNVGMSSDLDNAVYCRSSFNYVDGADRKSVEADIFDGRIGREQRDFAACGFTMCDHESAVTDWADIQHVHQVHGPEVKSFAQRFTGCDAVAVYPPILRGPAMAKLTPDYAPIEFVHSDFTTDYWDMVTNPDRQYQSFVGPLLHAHGLALEDLQTASRLMVLQLWRNTGATRADYPLAVCDPRTIEPDRLRPFMVESYGGQQLGFETFGISTPADDSPDRWYTFPSLQVDEVLVFRTYDSDLARRGLPFYTPHSAFRDPHVEATEQNVRESTEMRALCIWR